MFEGFFNWLSGPFTFMKYAIIAIVILIIFFVIWVTYLAKSHMAGKNQNIVGKLPVLQKGGLFGVPAHV